MKRSILGAGALAWLVSATPASADQPWYSGLHFDLHEPWSYSPMLGVATGAGGDGQVSVLELGLRLRYGRPPSDRHGAPSPKLLAFGAALATRDFDTIEPYGFAGLHLLPVRGTYWSQHIYLDLRADLGVGYRFARGTFDDSVVYSGKLAVGVLFAQEAEYMVYGVKSARDRFLGEFDLVVTTQVAMRGDWHVVGGIEFDPVRIFSNVARMVSY